MFNFKKGKVLRTLSLGIIGMLSMGLVLSNTSITSSAHNAYFLGITIDQSNGNFKYVPTVVYEENGNMSADNHREAQIGDFSSVSNNDQTFKDFELPYIADASSHTDEAKKAYADKVGSGNGDVGLQFTFPGLHGRDAKVPKVNASGIDQDIANFMAEHLVGDLNSAIGFVGSNTKIKANKSFSVDDYKKMVIDLVSTSQKVYASGSESSFSIVGGEKITITRGDKEGVKAIDGVSDKDYVVLKAPNGAVIPCLYHADKGYQKRSDISKSYKDSMKVDKWRVVDELNWKIIVLQGNYNADVKQITFASVNEIIKPSDVSLIIGEFFGGMLSGLRNLLGLYPLNDIFLNNGTRDTSYYYGLMPKAWMSSALLLHLVSQIIAWSVIGFAIIKILLKRQLQTMNIGERVSLMEGLKDLLVTGFALGAFALLFNVLVRANYYLVGIFGGSSSFSESIGQTTTMSTGFFATIIINFAFFIITVYFNFVYVLRAFTVALLYGIAPIAIVCIAFGGKYKQIFSSYIKELIANIFLQTFHAICVALFTNITGATQLRTFELFVILIGFIPLTKFVRQSILGLPAGITDEAGGMAKTMGSAGTAIGGFVAGGVASKFGSGSSSGSNAQSAGGNKGAVNNKIQDAINNKAPVNTSKPSMINRATNKIGNAVTGNDSEAKVKTTSNKDLMGNMNSGGNMSDVNMANSSELLASNRGSGKSNNSAKNLASKAYEGMGGWKGMAKAGAKASLGLAQIGGALGASAIGESKMADGLMKGAKGSFSDATSYGSAGASNSFNDTADSHGGKELYNSGESGTVVYDTNKDGEFRNEGLKNSDYGQNFKEMYDAFSGSGDYAQGGEKASYRKDAVNHYKSQGYQGLAYYNKGQGMAVKIDKNVMQKRGYDYRANAIPYNPAKSAKPNDRSNSNSNPKSNPNSQSGTVDPYKTTPSGIVYDKR